METIDFASEGLAPDLVPAAELADCAATALEEDGKRILSYGTGAGYTPLRELLAERFDVHPYRVWITNGWLQGFSLIARPRVAGQFAVTEYPTYDRALHVLFGASASLEYADWHANAGIDVANLKTQLRLLRAKPVLAYTAPTFHNPSGESLTLDQRWAYGQLLYDKQILTVEDDSYGLLRFEGDDHRTLFEMSDKTFVYSTSFSTQIAPGLRVAAFVLPQELVGELTTRANDTYITPALLGQATVFEFIRRGSFDTHVEWLREQLKERRDAMLAALEKHLPDATWSRPEGGIFLMVSLTPGTTAKQLLERAEGVTALAGEDFFGPPSALRLNYAGVALDEIEPGIERIAAAIESMTAS